MNEQNTPAPPPAQNARIIVSWVIVGVPLVYALINTVISVTPLFTG